MRTSHSPLVRVLLFVSRTFDPAFCRGDGKIDYVTGRLVREYTRSSYGNPVYQTEVYPLFYWWNHTMYNDPEQDGVNGNERVYQENVEFDLSRYKPCTFNGQPC